MKKVVLVLLVLSTVRLLVSCCGDRNYSFRWTGLKMQSIKYNPSGFVSITNDSVQAKDYGLRCVFDYEKVAAAGGQGFGITATYAWSCKGFSQNTDTIVDLSVTTRNAFDAAHPAGSTLNDLPIAKQGPLFGDTTYNPLRQVMAVLPELNGGSGGSSPYSELFISFLKVQPYPGNHRFIVRMRLASGRVLEDSASVRLY